MGQEHSDSIFTHNSVVVITVVLNCINSLVRRFGRVRFNKPYGGQPPSTRRLGLGLVGLPTTAG